MSGSATCSTAKGSSTTRRDPKFAFDIAQAGPGPRAVGNRTVVPGRAAAMSTHWPPAESNSFSTPSITCVTCRPIVPWKIAEQEERQAIQAPAHATETGRSTGRAATESDRPDPADAPRLRHGDLHGRNILVGIVRDQAMWPTVFDYEDMCPCNLIGWDFVKLETELKIRAYVDVFGGTAAAKFIRTDPTLRDRAEPRSPRNATAIAPGRRPGHPARPRNGCGPSCS